MPAIFTWLLLINRQDDGKEENKGCSAPKYDDYYNTFVYMYMYGDLPDLL